MYITDKLSNSLCDKLMKHEIITKETFVYYQYSFDFVLDLFTFNISLIVLGFLLGVPFLSVLYILTLTPLKMLAGGAHAWSRVSCSIISYSVFLFTILLIQYQVILLKPISAIIIYISSIALIIFFTPVDCKNKRIPRNKRMLFKKRCFVICFFLSVVFTYFVIYDCSDFMSLMTVCVTIIFINQVIGGIINKLHSRKE